MVPCVSLVLLVILAKEGFALDGFVFSSSRHLGEALLLPKCDAHLCNATDVNKRCDCHDTCYQRRDCCLDALSDDRVAQLVTGDLWSCVWTLRGRGPFAVIGKCPSAWTNEGVRKACEDPTDPKEDPNRALPVRSTKTNSTYKNIYCGQCNEGDIQPGQYQLKFRCSRGENVTSVPAALQEKNCDAYVNEKSASFCVSLEKTVTSCPDAWQHKNATYAKEVRWRCHSYFAPITVNTTRYKNAFCAMCNNVTLRLEDIICRSSYYPIEKEYILTIDGEFKSGTLIPGTEGGKLCKPGEVYDPFRKQCRQVMCSNESDCNATHALWKDELQEEQAAPSPCNMTLLGPGNFTLDKESSKITVTFGEPVTYEEGEYEFITAGEHNGSVLVCQRGGSQAVPLFPQHFCERRRLLGYGSCGCETDCVQGRLCCLDALDEATVKELMGRGDAWLCLNDTRHSSALTKCPSNFTDRLLRNQCESVSPIAQDPLLHVPVFAWKNGIVYRNVFCAACNGITNVTFYDVRFLCAEHAKVHNGLEAAETYMENPELCSMRLEPSDPDLPIKPCVEDPQCKQCPPAWGKKDDPRQMAVRWRCEHYYAPVTINGTCYRNDFCAFCNNVNPTDPALKRRYSDHMSKSPAVPPAKDSFSTFTVG